MICIGCLDECLQQYAFFRKLKIANQQLQQLYDEAQLEACGEEEIISEDPVWQPVEESQDCVDSDLEFIVLEPEQLPATAEQAVSDELRPKPSQKLANHDSLIVSEFLPATTAPPCLDLSDSHMQQLAPPPTKCAP